MVQNDRDVRFVPKADIVHLFDHLIGCGEELRTDFKAQRLRRLEINREIKFGGSHDRQFAWLLAWSVILKHTLGRGR